MKSKSKLAVEKSPRPKTRPADLAAGAAVERGNRIKKMERVEEDAMKKAKGGKVKKMAMGGKVKKMAMGDKAKKMAMGGSCRGMGAAKKGGKYSRMG